MIVPRLVRRGCCVSRCYSVTAVLLCAGVLALSSACGNDECGGYSADEDDAAPRLQAFRLDNQLRGDWWTLVFAAKFADSDGNLGGGTASFYVNSGSDATVIGLPEVFLQSEVPLNATQGMVAIPLRFGDSLSDGARVRLSLQLKDEAGLRSNCYSLDLRFAVEAVAAALQEWWSKSFAATLDNVLGALG